VKKQSCKTNKDIYIISFSLKFFLKFLSFNIFLFLLNNLFIKIYNIPLKEKIADKTNITKAKESGKNIFQHNLINWSILYLGKDALTQI
jgi:hypothetical protein